MKQSQKRGYRYYDYDEGLLRIFFSTMHCIEMQRKERLQRFRYYSTTGRKIKSKEYDDDPKRYSDKKKATV